MWFRKLKLKNVCRHRDLTLELKQGSIGIVGPNGSGKSTILDLMFAAVTGDFGRFPGVKIDCINNVCGDEPSCLSAVIEHEQHVLTIERSLRPARTELVVDDEKPITDAKKAQVRIDEVLGIDRTMMDLYVFKQQHSIYDFLQTTPTERAKAFAVLCRTEVCEDIWEMLGKWLSKDTEVNAIITDNSDELLQDVSGLKLRIKEQRTTIEAETPRLLNARSEESANEIIGRCRRLEDLKSESIRLVEDLDAVDEDVVTARKLQIESFQECDKAKRKIEGGKKANEANRDALRDFVEYDRQKELRRKARDTDAALQDEFKQRTKPKKPAEYDGFDMKEKRRQALALDQALAAARSIIKKFNSDEVVACPTCGTPVKTLQEHLTAQRRIIKEYPARIDALEADITRVELYDIELRKHGLWKEGYDARVEANRKELEGFAELTRPEGTREELERAVADYETLLEVLDGLVEQNHKRERKVTELEAEQKVKTRRWEEVDQAVKDNTDPPEKVERARARLKEHAAASTNIARAEGQIDSIRDQIDDKERDLAKLRVKLKRSRKVREMAHLVREARDVLHRDNLPRRVAQVNLQRMEGDVNENLSLFGDPYWVETDATLTFVAHKPGEPAQYATRLSTGQKVVLALSFWPAVASLWGTDLGMLGLDEPTANLDEDNRKLLAQAMTTWSAKVRGRRQLVMVTHDPNLRSSFDQIVDLG